MNRNELLKGSWNEYYQLMSEKLRPQMKIEVRFKTFNAGIAVPTEDVEYIREFSESDPLSRRLPQERLEITLIDPNGKYDFGTAGSLIPTYKGAIRVELSYVLYDNQDTERVEFRKSLWFMQDKPTRKDFRITFRCCGIFEMMNGIQFYKNNADDVEVTTVAYTREILEDASKMIGVDINQDENADTDLIKLNERLPITTHAQAIQTIANLFSRNIIVERYDRYRLEYSNIRANSESRVFKRYEILKNGISKKITPLLKKSEVYWYTDAAVSENLETISKITVHPGDTSYHVEHSPMVGPLAFVAPNVTGYNYRDATDLEVDEGLLSDVEVDISGRRLRETAQSIQKVYRDAGEENIVKNPLCDSYAKAQDLMRRQWLYYSYRSVYIIEHRGDPSISCGDCFQIELPSGKVVEALVLSTETEYNGSLKGRMVVKVDESAQ